MSETDQETVAKTTARRPLGLLPILALHLVPGIVFALVFSALAKALTARGSTAYLALILTIPICLVPMELGIMAAWSRRATGRYSVRDALGYRGGGGVAEWILMPIALFFVFVVLSLGTGMLSKWLEGILGPSTPAWLSTEQLVRGIMSVSSAQRTLTFILAAVLSGVVAPAVEEAYFRGFLLPKMGSLKGAAPLVNALLFALYHFYFPWGVPAVFVIFIPIAYVAWVRRNFLVGTVVHALINLTGLLQVIWLTRQG